MEKEIKVGDYIRLTDNRGIKKVLELGEYLGINQYLINEDGTYVIDNSITNSSPNIIDLIEEGDYVNGREVTPIMIEMRDKEGVFGIPDRYMTYIKKIDIKSIVTKEQFESMEYKV